MKAKKQSKASIEAQEKHLTDNKQNALNFFKSLNKPLDIKDGTVFSNTFNGEKVLAKCDAFCYNFTKKQSGLDEFLNPGKNKVEIDKGINTVILIDVPYNLRNSKCAHFDRIKEGSELWNELQFMMFVADCPYAYFLRYVAKTKTVREQVNAETIKASPKFIAEKLNSDLAYFIMSKQGLAMGF